MAAPIITRKTISLADAIRVAVDLAHIELSDNQAGFTPTEVIRARTDLLDAKYVKLQSSITAASLRAFVDELLAVSSIAQTAQDECVSECGGIEKKDCLVKSKCGRSVSIEVREDQAAGTMQVFTVPVKTTTIPKGRDTDAEMRERLQSQRR